MARRLRWLVLAVGLFVLAGCQTEAFVELQVDDNGGGAVYVALAFDQEAAARTVLYEAPTPIADLTATGWTVTGPAQEGDGRIWVRAQKEFSRREQIPQLMEEIGGKGGPFQNFTVERATSFGKRSWQFSGTVDLRGGLKSFTDPELAAALGGNPLGQPPERFQEALGGQTLESLVKLNVLVDLPGDVASSNGTVGKAGTAAPTTTTTSGATAQPPAAQASASTAGGTSTTARHVDKGAAILWTPSFADGSPTELRVTSSSSRLLPRLWRWLGLSAGIVGGAALLYQVAQLFLDRARERRRVPQRSVRATEPAEPQPIPVGRLQGGGSSGAGVGGASGAPPGGSPSPSAGGATQTAVEDHPTGRSGVSGTAGSRADPGPTGSHGAGTAGQWQGAGAVGQWPEAAIEAVPIGTSGRPASVGPLREDHAPGAPRGTEARSVGQRGLSLIVIETTGVLFAGRDPVGEVLVPFARERGCVLSVRQIADLYLGRLVGAMEPAKFWSELGISGDPMLLDDIYARRFELTDHVLGFLAQARQRGVAVAGLGDDVPEWTAVFRQRFHLDGLIGAWVSSAEVGVRVPHPGLLEAVERATGQPPSASMVIAGSRALLDAAKRLGYRTIQYNAGPDDPESEHPVLRTFADRGRSSDPSPAV